MTFWVSYWLLTAKVVPLDVVFLSTYLRHQFDRATQGRFWTRE